jgi:Domain of unknown function (DUF4184)
LHKEFIDMPFTFAHPAIILPLAKSGYKLSLTGLVAGSMVPDFEFFLSMKAGENIGHHLPGVLVFDIPVAILLCFVYHGVVRDVLISNLPAFLQSRFTKYTGSGWNTYAMQHKGKLIISIMIGIGSHFFWDAFTHYDGLFVTIFPWLARELTLAGNAVAVYSLLQVASSIGGLWVIQRVVRKLPAEPTAPPNQRNQSTFWTACITAGVTLFMIRVLTQAGQQGFWDVFMAAMGSTLYTLTGVSLLFKQLQLPTRHAQQQ